MLSLRMANNLLQQRTDYLKHLEKHYLTEMTELYQSLEPHLPERVGSVMDVGCGLGGINVRMAKRYPHAEFIMVDRDGDGGSKVDWHDQMGKFGCYNNLKDTQQFLKSQGVKNRIKLWTTIPKDQPVDLAYSFLSWGFHYPLNSYRIKAKTLILDIRRGYGQTPPTGSKIIHKGKKHDRWLIKNFLCS